VPQVLDGVPPRCPLHLPATLPEFLAIASPLPEPDGLPEFWRRRQAAACAIPPEPRLRRSGLRLPGTRVLEFSYQSSDGWRPRGWLLLPRVGEVRQVLIVGHGYGGRDGPDRFWRLPGCALMFPCFRGLGLSRGGGIPSDPDRHVLHGIEDPERYVLGGCADDLWCAVNAAHTLFGPVPVDYAGISFGGGIGALAAPFDPRIERVHLNVPTFGHQPWRLCLPCAGSGEAVRRWVHQHRRVPETLRLFDAALTARHARQPLLLAGALLDAVVPPAGQFAIFNAWGGPRQLLVLSRGHAAPEGQGRQDRQVRVAVTTLFRRAPDPLSKRVLP